jgi:hypothetical protein
MSDQLHPLPPDAWGDPPDEEVLTMYAQGEVPTTPIPVTTDPPGGS